MAEPAKDFDAEQTRLLRDDTLLLGNAYKFECRACGKISRGDPQAVTIQDGDPIIDCGLCQNPECPGFDCSPKERS